MNKQSSGRRSLTRPRDYDVSTVMLYYCVIIVCFKDNSTNRPVMRDAGVGGGQGAMAYCVSLSLCYVVCYIIVL